MTKLNDFKKIYEKINRYINPHYLLPLLFIPFIMSAGSILLPQTTNAQNTNFQEISNSMLIKPSHTHITYNDNLPSPHNPNRAIWYPVTLTNSNMSSYYFSSSHNTTFSGTIENYSYNQQHNVLILISMINSNNMTVAKKSWKNISLAPFQMLNIRLTSPLNLNSGKYYVNIGVYTPEGSKLLGWYPHYQTFIVS